MLNARTQSLLNRLFPAYKLGNKLSRNLGLESFSINFATQQYNNGESHLSGIVLPAGTLVKGLYSYSDGLLEDLTSTADGTLKCGDVNITDAYEFISIWNAVPEVIVPFTPINDNGDTYKFLPDGGELKVQFQGNSPTAGTFRWFFELIYNKDTIV
jgi:hypothetical protein